MGIVLHEKTNTQLWDAVLLSWKQKKNLWEAVFLFFFFVSEAKKKEKLFQLIESYHFTQKYFSYSFQIKGKLWRKSTTVVTVFLFIMNQTDFRLVHNQEENSFPQKDRFPFHHELNGLPFSS